MPIKHTFNRSHLTLSSAALALLIAFGSVPTGLGQPYDLIAQADRGSALLRSLSPGDSGGVSRGSGSSAALRGKVQYLRFYPPQAGVKLLEDILNRVRMVPQLAMQKNLRFQFQTSDSSQAAQQGPTDYRLAIKPKEAPWSQRQREGNEQIQVAMNKKGFWEKEKSYSGGQARRKAESALYGSEESEEDTLSRGIWERAAELKQQADRPTPVPKWLSPAQEKLAVSAGKLYNLARQLQGVNELAANLPGAQHSDGQPQLKGDSGARSYRSAPQTIAMSDEMASVRDMRKKGIEEYGATAVNLAPPLQGGGGGTGVPSSESSAVTGALSASNSARGRVAMGNVPPAPQAASPLINLPPPAASLNTEARLRSQFRDAADKDSQIALLPPTVVTGIPMVRLGASEAQAGQALAAVGASARERVGGWTVWSYRKAGAREPLLQVFMRHGQVEALRIFDSSLIGPDFGVRLGADLGAVKERFGEPAFIVAEPAPAAGMNYVYPISQVAFLMARPTAGAAPQLVSLLIFNVK